MEEMYYREFGIPARIARCFSVEEAEEQKKQYDGKKNCYISVYTFDDLFETKGKTEYTSAVLNTIWFDFDDNKKIVAEGGVLVKEKNSNTLISKEKILFIDFLCLKKNKAKKRPTKLHFVGLLRILFQY